MNDGTIIVMYEKLFRKEKNTLKAWKKPHPDYYELEINCQRYSSPSLNVVKVFSRVKKNVIIFSFPLDLILG